MANRDMTPRSAIPDPITMANAANAAEQLDHDGEAGDERTYTAGDEWKLRDRQPKGDHNRRLALGLDVDEFAAAAGVTSDELREYEQTWPDHEFDLDVARKVGAALERLERNPPPSQKVDNGPAS
jgi:hypothetical protein